MHLLKSHDYRFAATSILFILLCLTISCSDNNSDANKRKQIQVELFAYESVHFIKNSKVELTEYSILVKNNSAYSMQYFDFYRDYHWPADVNKSIIYFIVDEDGKKYPHCGYPSSTPAASPDTSKTIGVGDTVKIYLTVAGRSSEKASDVFKRRFCIKSSKRIFLQAFYIELLNKNNAYDQIKNGNYKIIADSNLVSIGN